MNTHIIPDWPIEETADNAAGGNAHLWEESWDDDDTNEDFAKELRYVDFFLSAWVFPHGVGGNGGKAVGDGAHVEESGGAWGVCGILLDTNSDVAWIGPSWRRRKRRNKSLGGRYGSSCLHACGFGRRIA